MKKQKGFIKMVLIIIAIIAVAVFIYIRMGYRMETIPSNVTDNKVNSSLQSSEKDITADWKTYKNDKYGFEVKYPQDWVLETDFQYIAFVNPENNYTIGFNVLVRDTPDDSVKDLGRVGYRKDYVNIVEADKVMRTRLPIEAEDGNGFGFVLGRIESELAEKGSYAIGQAVFINDKFGYIIGYGIGEDSDKNWDQATIEKMDDIVRSFKFTK